MGTLVDFLREYQNNSILEHELPEEIVNRYTVEACLKFAEEKQVYLVRQNESGKKCILKFLSGESMENMEEEYLLYRQLQHPGLTSAIECKKDRQYSYLIREYIEGNTVTELVEMTGRGYLENKEIVKIAIQLCDILQYLHSQKPPIIHRDIKPENIIITKNGSCKLIDFGISRRFRSEQVRDTVFMGTAETAPPEQYGYKQTDARSDIYSMGMLLCYMATGSYELQELKQSKISGFLRHCIARCTKFSPDARYASAKQLKAQLKKYEILYVNKKVSKALRQVMLLILTAACSAYLTWNLMSYKMSQQESSATLTAPLPQVAEDTQRILPNATVMAGQVSAVQGAFGQQSVDREEYGFTDETPYRFTSSLIEAAVRSQLRKSATETIYYGDLKRITELYLCGKQIYQNWDDHFVYGKNQYMSGEEYSDDTLYNTRGNISSLEDMKYMQNLQILTLYNQNIYDLTPLQDLKFLTDLGLGNNSIREITALEGLEQLQRLDLSGNLITNYELEDVAKMPKLESLDLGDTKVTSLKNVENMPLTYLSVLGDKMDDMEGLEKMISLEHLITSGVNEGINLEGLKRIAGLPGLRELNIIGSDDFELSLLSSLTTLRTLDLCNCRVGSLEGLELANLEELRADEITQLSLTGIENNELLSRLSLRNSVVLDFTPLKKLEYLQYVNCNSQQEEQIREQLGSVSFTVNVQTHY